MRRLFLVLLASTLAGAACRQSGGTLVEIQRAKAGSLDVVLLSSQGKIAHGNDSFSIEFRAADGALVDVGEVTAKSTMPMPGMPMFGSLDVRKSATAGRYDVDSKFDMAGTWRTTIEWQGGSGGPGSVTLSGNVQ